MNKAKYNTGIVVGVVLLVIAVYLVSAMIGGGFWRMLATASTTALLLTNLEE